MPRFTAGLKPVFSARAISCTSGWCVRSQSTEPSVEPLSTTLTRQSPQVCRRMESRQPTSMWRPLRLGMTMSTEKGPGTIA